MVSQTPELCKQMYRIIADHLSELTVRKALILEQVYILCQSLISIGRVQLAKVSCQNHMLATHGANLGCNILNWGAVMECGKETVLHIGSLSNSHSLLLNCIEIRRIVSVGQDNFASAFGGSLDQSHPLVGTDVARAHDHAVLGGGVQNGNRFREQGSVRSKDGQKSGQIRLWIAAVVKFLIGQRFQCGKPHQSASHLG